MGDAVSGKYGDLIKYANEIKVEYNSLKTYMTIYRKFIAEDPNFNPKSKAQYYINKQVSEDFIKLGSRFGACSMILRRGGIKKIYEFILSHSIFFPYDMDYYLPPGIQIYTVVDNVVSNLTHSISDNGQPGYLNSQ